MLLLNYALNENVKIIKYWKWRNIWRTFTLQTYAQIAQYFHIMFSRHNIMYTYENFLRQNSILIFIAVSRRKKTNQMFVFVNIHSCSLSTQSKDALYWRLRLKNYAQSQLCFVLVCSFQFCFLYFLISIFEGTNLDRYSWMDK